MRYIVKRRRISRKLSGHTTDHYINGVPAKEKEYISTLEKICGGDVNKTKVLMLVGYFSEVLSIQIKGNFYLRYVIQVFLMKQLLIKYFFNAIK